ncbi:MAG: hypothetical protein FWF98_04890 [Dehalococcoidia bacterium]|nr:hypothetical protein [Dehalococcoidia bacterium]
MKRKSTKLMALIISVLMLTALLPTVAFAAVDDIQITNVSATIAVPVAGENPAFTVTSDVNSEYIVRVWRWRQNYITPSVDLPPSSTFTAGASYSVWLEFVPQSGYKFFDINSLDVSPMYNQVRENVNVIVNGQSLDLYSFTAGGQTVTVQTTNNGIIICKIAFTAICEHDYSIDETIPPTCTEQGYTTYTCSICGNSYVDEDSYVPALGHEYIDDPDSADYIVPTCTEPGFMPAKCSVCGEPGEGYELAAIGHNWNRGVVTVKPTAHAEGEKLFTCKNCGETYSIVLPKLTVNGLSADAFVEKLNGNKNSLTITITELVSKAGSDKQTEATYTETFSINNNAAGIYEVGPYSVYVDTKGNTQIREIYIVE